MHEAQRLPQTKLHVHSARDTHAYSIQCLHHSATCISIQPADKAVECLINSYKLLLLIVGLRRGGGGGGGGHWHRH